MSLEDSWFTRISTSAQFFVKLGQNSGMAQICTQCPPYLPSRCAFSLWGAGERMPCFTRLPCPQVPGGSSSQPIALHYYKVQAESQGRKHPFVILLCTKIWLLGGHLHFCGLDSRRLVGSSGGQSQKTSLQVRSLGSSGFSAGQLLIYETSTHCRLTALAVIICLESGSF